jgi:hypothetical protein
MIPDGNIANSVQAVNRYSFFGYAPVGKMQIMEVTMENPPTVLVTVLVFSPSFELFPDKRPYFRERPF